MHEVFDMFDIIDEKQIQEERLLDHIKALKTVHDHIKLLKESQLQLEKKIAELAEHPTERDDNYSGRKTYHCMQFKVCIKTGWNYRINKKQYNLIKNNLDPFYNPVIEQTAYKINEDLLERIEQMQDSKGLQLLNDLANQEILTKSPKKINVTLEISE